MDFNQLLSRMQELDSPALEATTDECGMPPAPMSAKPDTPPPSMSVNVNAQGMDNIESMLSLMAKLSGAGKADTPSMTAMPAIMPLDKMVPDMDADNDDKVGGEMDFEIGDKEEDFTSEGPVGAALGAGAAKVLKGAPTPKPGAAAAGAALGAAAKAAGSAMGAGVAAGGSLGAAAKGAVAGAAKGAAQGATKAQPPGVGMKANAPDADDDGKIGMGKNVDPKQIKLDDIDMEELLKLAGQETEGAMDDAAKDFSAYHQAQAASTEKTMAAIRDAIKAALTSDPKDQNNDDDGEKNADEAYANEPNEMGRDSDYMNNKLAGGMNRQKGTHPKVSDADNPMQKVREGDELRSQIHAELSAKLAEFMGAK
jgi:hypothetical protein